MRTKKQIEAKIKCLQKERQKLPHHSFFGTDNWGQIDMQIKILEKAFKSTDADLEIELDDICDRYNGDFPPDDTIDKWIVDVLDWLLKHTEDL